MRAYRKNMNWSGDIRKTKSCFGRGDMADREFAVQLFGIREEKHMQQEIRSRYDGYETQQNRSGSGIKNEMRLEFDSRSCNEGFARVAVAAFMTQLNPTVEEVSDVKTAVSEAVTNAIIHGYEGTVRKVVIHCAIQGQELLVEVEAEGKGIPDVALAMEPLYTTKAECDRAGMGFAFMEAFMDSLEVESAPGKGTRVRMTKCISRENAEGPGGYGKKTDHSARQIYGSPEQTPVTEKTETVER